MTLSDIRFLRGRHCYGDPHSLSFLNNRRVRQASAAYESHSVIAVYICVLNELPIRHDPRIALDHVPIMLRALDRLGERGIGEDLHFTENSLSDSLAASIIAASSVKSG